MKRNNPSDWEEIQDPELYPQDLEEAPLEDALPTGERYDEDQVWRRPDRTYGAQSPVPKRSQKEGASYEEGQAMRSSEQLYYRASQAKSYRSSDKVTHNHFTKKASRRRIIIQTSVTLALLAVIGLLAFGIMNQLDLREEIQGRPTLASVSGGTPLTSAPTEADVSRESEVTEPLASVSVEIIGSWADRSPETTPAVSADEAAPTSP